jgi:predicted ATPase
MAVNDEVRRLDKKWRSNTGWPQRLEWLEVSGLRGWNGQRLKLDFPIVAIVGENGSGKSALLQAAACAYQGDGDSPTWYPSEFFPETAWDTITNSALHYGYVIGEDHPQHSLRKPTSRWLGQPERPKRRVQYTDLNRIQPVGARVGYARIAKTKHEEKSANEFAVEQVARFSSVMGREYESARMALSTIDDGREVPVIARAGIEYSGFHQGSGEITVAELLKKDLPKYGLVLIDEIESSLHPRAQRRLIRYLAEQSRHQEAQIILTTHSPYVLDELPPQARVYILESKTEKELVYGISPDFAMTKMDDDVHPECDLYVEDEAAKTMLEELLAAKGKELFMRCTVVPFGASNVGYALGQMVDGGRFRRPTAVFLDGDNATGPGCTLLPGGDAPERVVFKSLRAVSWGDVWTRVGRDTSSVDDACSSAMLLTDHHDWVSFAANQLRCGGGTLWQAMCAEWAKRFPNNEAQTVLNAVTDALP